MCGRYVIQVAGRAGASSSMSSIHPFSTFAPRWNTAPSQIVPMGPAHRRGSAGPLWDLADRLQPVPALAGGGRLGAGPAQPAGGVP
jgi:hypothetical protein